jgi:hypothetical protein
VSSALRTPCYAPYPPFFHFNNGHSTPNYEKERCRLSASLFLRWQPPRRPDADPGSLLSRLFVVLLSFRLNHFQNVSVYDKALLSPQAMSSLQHCLGLAAQIKDRSEESIFHPDLRQLRLELRHACYDVLKADLRSAQVRLVICHLPCLWWSIAAPPNRDVSHVRICVSPF